MTDSKDAPLLNLAVEQGIPIATDMIKVAVQDEDNEDVVLGQLQPFLLSGPLVCLAFTSQQRH